jgi:hypothetical protein
LADYARFLHHEPCALERSNEKSKTIPFIFVPKSSYPRFSGKVILAIRFNYFWLAVVLGTAFQANAGDAIWQEVKDLRARNVAQLAQQFRVDTIALRQRLHEASLWRSHEPAHTISLPLPDGSLGRFQVYESPIMADELAQRYPDIKTYKVYGIDDPSATGRLDITPQGFHAMLHTAQGRLMIDPNSTLPQNDRYAVRVHGEAMNTGFSCGVAEHDFPASSILPTSSAARPAARISGSLLEYRLAVAATEEYVARVGSANDVVRAQVEIVTAINRVNEIYERDLGIRLTLVGKNDQLIENGGNVSFTDGDPTRMFSENQAWIDSKIGKDNYDLGHVFGIAGGGLAYLGSACDGSRKAKGVTAIPYPRHAPYFIDFVAHEIGHQFNADHSFNGTTKKCASARNAATAFEPGSGSTIMSYSGLCGVENLQSRSDDTFHAASIAAINSFTSNAGSCHTQIAADPPNPNEPVVAALTNKSIPANTAFVLDGSASDADGHVLTFQWDQMDKGCATDSNSYGTDIGNNPLFRSYPPRMASKRHFPALGTQLKGRYDKAEVTPCHDRDLNFRLTARDNASGQDTADVQLSVKDTGAIFEITNLDDGKTINNSFVVNWRVASTNSAPINCSNVDIDLLTFAPGYARYSVHPLTTTSNTGNATVSITSITKSHPRARIRVKCSNNYFYDVSDVDFAVDGTAPAPFDDSANRTFFNVGFADNVAPACPAVAKCVNKSKKSKGGGASVDYRWLLLVSGLLLLAWIRRRAAVSGLAVKLDDGVVLERVTVRLLH